MISALWREKKGTGKLWAQRVEYNELVYTTQVNSAFRERWLASSEVISQVLFTSEQPKRNKMARFATVTKEKFIYINEAAVTKNTKMAAKFSLTALSGKIFNCRIHTRDE